MNDSPPPHRVANLSLCGSYADSLARWRERIGDACGHRSGTHRRRARIGRGPVDGERANAVFYERTIAEKDRQIRVRIIVCEAELQDAGAREIAGDVIEHVGAAPNRANGERIGLLIVGEREDRGVRQARSETAPAGKIAIGMAVGGHERIASIVGIVESADQERVSAINIDEGERGRANEIRREVVRQRPEARALVDTAEKLDAVGHKEAPVGSQVELD